MHLYHGKKGEWIERERNSLSVLGFLLEGKVSVIVGANGTQELQAGQMFFIPVDEPFTVTVEADALLLTCQIDQRVAFCQCFTMKSLFGLADRLPGEEAGRIPVLPINAPLAAELDAIRRALDAGLWCDLYQQMKRETLLVLLRGFYTKEQLAYLFRPVLSPDFEFKQQVFELFPQAANASDLARQFGLPPSSFNRRFRTVFGTPPGEWIIKKRAEAIYRDLMLTELTTVELADKYMLTPNYLIKFCKEHFGATPAELRRQHKR